MNEKNLSERGAFRATSSAGTGAEARCWRQTSTYFYWLGDGDPVITYARPAIFDQLAPER